MHGAWQILLAPSSNTLWEPSTLDLYGIVPYMTRRAISDGPYRCTTLSARTTTMELGSVQAPLGPAIYCSPRHPAGRYCSPRGSHYHKLPFNSRDEGSKCVGCRHAIQLVDNARRIIQRIMNPRSLNYMASYDLASTSNIWRALPRTPLPIAVLPLRLVSRPHVLAEQCTETATRTFMSQRYSGGGGVCRRSRWCQVPVLSTPIRINILTH